MVFIISCLFFFKEGHTHTQTVVKLLISKKKDIHTVGKQQTASAAFRQLPLLCLRHAQSEQQDPPEWNPIRYRKQPRNAHSSPHTSKQYLRQLRSATLYTHVNIRCHCSVLFSGTAHEREKRSNKKKKCTALVSPDINPPVCHSSFCRSCRLGLQ